MKALVPPVRHPLRRPPRSSATGRSHDDRARAPASPSFSLLPMDLPRTFRSLLLVTLLGQLVACATPEPAPVTDVVASQVPAAAVPVSAASLPVAPVVAAAPAGPARASATPVAAEPVVIRGNDRLLAPPSGGAGAVRGPASTFNFQDAPTAEVVQVMLRDLLKVDYVVHPPLPGTITLITRTPISADKAFNLLESALQINGVVMARDPRGT